MGRRHVLADRFDEAAEWFAYARSSAPRSDPKLLARTSFEMGCIYLQRGEVTAAELIAEWDGTDADQPDLAHLRALILESRGEYLAAERAYRDAVAARRQSLTPHTAVLALRNFAAMLCHRSPEEAIGLCGLALALTRGFLLDRRLEPSIKNVMCYALLCGGRIDDAVEIGSSALAGAKVEANARVHSYARFNLAIASELKGDLKQAIESLSELASDATPGGNGGTLAQWARVRLAWLACLSGHADESETVLATALPNREAPEISDSISTLSALIAFRRGEFAPARQGLARLAESYRARSDEMTSFVLNLWVARVELAGGREAAARRACAQAMRLAMSRGFRVSPNWWSDELADAAVSLADSQTRKYADALVRSRTVPVDLPRVRTLVGLRTRSGEILIDGAALPQHVWQRGRTGQRVLRRFVSALALARPLGLLRDDLADLLWPESDGDRALNNLYAATYDLRQVLAHVPGLALAVDAQRYRFRADPLVAFLDDSPEPADN